MKTGNIPGFVLALGLVGLLASFHPGGSRLEYALAGKSGLRWLVAGSAEGVEGECVSEGRHLTFIRQGAQVKEELCANDVPVVNTFTYVMDWGNRGEQIAFNGAVYIGRVLTSSPQACNGSPQCVRLSTLNMNKMDRSTDIYLINPTHVHP